MPSILNIVLTPPDDSLLYVGHYDALLVAFSVALAILAAYAALLVSRQVETSLTEQARRLWTVLGGVCLGIGIWAMHFIGMLAFSLPCSTRYDPTLTAVSTLPGILASILAIKIISRPRLSHSQLATGGLLIGAGIGAMHYSGMAAMRLEGLIRYDLKLFMLSIVVAVALATLALWVKFRIQTEHADGMTRATIVSAVVLGLAASGMHYTAMAAAYFIRDGDSTAVTSGMSSAALASIVLLATSFIVISTIVATYVGHRHLASLRRSHKMIALLIATWGIIAWVSVDYYYQSRAGTAYQNSARAATQQLEQIVRSMDEDIQRLKGVAQVVSRNKDTQTVLRRFGATLTPSTLAHEERKQRWMRDQTLAELDRSLALAASNLQAEVIYILNAAGDCVAASNAFTPASFVGSNFADRDYYRQPRGGQTGQQYAMGRISKIPGLYYSFAVRDQERFLGVVVVKRDLGDFSRWTNSTSAFVADSNGVIVLAAKPTLKFRSMPGATIESMSSEKRLLQYQQSGFVPLTVTPWQRERFPAAVRIDGGDVPQVLVSRSLPEVAISIYVPQALGELLQLETESFTLFFLLAMIGSLLILTTAAIVHYWRETKAVEADLRIAATAFETQDGMIITDPTGTIQRINQAFTRITGYTAEEAIGQNPRILASGQQGTAFYAAMWESLTRNSTWQGEIHNRRRDGEPCIHRVVISAVRLASGELLHYVGAYTDITERKQAEAQLSDSKEMMQAGVSAGGIFPWVWDIPADRLTWGVSPEPLLGPLPDGLLAYPDFRELVHPEDKAAYIEAGRSALKAGDYYYNEFRVVATDGAVRWISAQGTTLRDAASMATRMVGAAINITKRKEIEQQLEYQKGRLEELVEQRTHSLTEALEAAKLADHAKDAFLANMSHELRTPLNGVIGMAGLARNISSDPRQRDYLDKIVSSGKHLNRIINDLLDLSKIAAGHMELETIHFSLSALLGRVTSMMTHRAQEKGLKLIVSVGPDVPEVLLGDAFRIDQILLNLVGNAIKFTSTGHIEIRVGSRATAESRVCLEIEIEDTGIGMPPKDLERLFMPFSQADATVSRQYGGTGLGLAISRRLAEMMDGDISVHSKEGVGTTFRVSIRLGRGEAADLAPDSEPAGEETIRARYRDVRILVVEDQPLNREIIDALLGDVGIAARMAENGQVALDILRAAGPDAFDLVLMDIQMPVLNGLEATGRILAIAPDLPVVGQSAYAFGEDRDACLAAGMVDHVAKPIDWDEVVEVVRRHVRAHPRATMGGTS